MIILVVLLRPPPVIPIMEFRPSSVEPHVLILEDEKVLADLYKTWLGDEYDVTVAYGCATALDLLDDTLDVALLDRRLQDCSGDMVLEEIQERNIDCRVAMVTAVQPTFEIIEMGFDDYVCKPSSKAELRDTVERLVTQSKYSEAINELYTLTSKKALLEVEYSTNVLEECEEYAELERRCANLREEVDSMASGLSNRQIVAEAGRQAVSGG